jgi:hypothetical protein
LPRQRDKPQLAAVSLHDRSTDRQSHAHSFRFGSKEAIENMDSMLRLEASARVLNGDQQFPWGLSLRADLQFSLSFYGIYGLDAIHHKVQDNLLQFNPGAKDWWQSAPQFSLDRNAILLRFCNGQRKNLVNDLI